MENPPRDIQQAPGVPDPKNPQNTNMKRFPNHKQVVEGLGYVPGVCFLRPLSYMFGLFSGAKMLLVLGSVPNHNQGELDLYIWGGGGMF